MRFRSTRSMTLPEASATSFVCQFLTGGSALAQFRSWLAAESCPSDGSPLPRCRPSRFCKSRLEQPARRLGRDSESPAFRSPGVSANHTSRPVYADVSSDGGSAALQWADLVPQRGSDPCRRRVCLRSIVVLIVAALVSVGSFESPVVAQPSDEKLIFFLFTDNFESGTLFKWTEIEPPIPSVAWTSWSSSARPDENHYATFLNAGGSFTGLESADQWLVVFVESESAPGERVPKVDVASYGGASLDRLWISQPVLLVESDESIRGEAWVLPRPPVPGPVIPGQQLTLEFDGPALDVDVYAIALRHMPEGAKLTVRPEMIGYHQDGIAGDVLARPSSLSLVFFLSPGGWYFTGIGDQVMRMWRGVNFNGAYFELTFASSREGAPNLDLSWKFPSDILNGETWQLRVIDLVVEEGEDR